MRGLTAIILGVGLLLSAPELMGQKVADRAAAVSDGKVRMTYVARPGVCGDGRNVTLDSERCDSDWFDDCESGPVRVVLRLRDGVVVDIDTHVGGHWPPADEKTLDLGMVPAADAADYLVGIGRLSDAAGDDALFAASLADSVILWPTFLDLAGDQSLESETRQMAVFLLSQAASEAATAGLAEIVDEDSGDREVREMAVFALSQRPADEAVPALIAIVEENRDPDVVRSAIFWLGQSGDSRALELFRRLLLED